MRKKLVFILVVLVFVSGLSVAAFLKREEAHQARLCEISEYLSDEEKLLQRHVHRESADDFFWRYYGEKQALQAEQKLKQLKSTLGSVECAGLLNKDLEWLFVLTPVDQRQFISIQKQVAFIRSDFLYQINLLKNKKTTVFLELQDDLKKYRFHVQQLRQGEVPKKILEKACRTPASVMNAKKQQSCKKALILTKEFRVKDENNLGHNRRILLEKWIEFKEWVDAAVSKIDQIETEEVAEGVGD